MTLCMRWWGTGMLCMSFVVILTCGHPYTPPGRLWLALKWDIWLHSFLGGVMQCGQRHFLPLVSFLVSHWGWFYCFFLSICTGDSTHGLPQAQGSSPTPKKHHLTLSTCWYGLRLLLLDSPQRPVWNASTVRTCLWYLLDQEMDTIPRAQIAPDFPEGYYGAGRVKSCPTSAGGWDGSYANTIFLQSLLFRKIIVFQQFFYSCSDLGRGRWEQTLPFLTQFYLMA